MENKEMEHYLKLTLAVYRVTQLFPPEGEELKLKMRKLANQALVVLLCPNLNLTDLNWFEELAELFEEAETKNWVDPRNFLVLRREYGKIQKSISRRPKMMKFNNHRQRTIYHILKEKRQAQLRDLLPSFPQVSRRTIIRDLEELCQAGIVIKTGNGAATSYLFNVRH